MHQLFLSVLILFYVFKGSCHQMPVPPDDPKENVTELIGNKEKALTECLSTIEALKASGQETLLLRFLQQAADLSYELHDTISALNYYLEIADRAETSNQLLPLSDSYNQLGKHYYSTQNYQTATKYFIKTLETDRFLQVSDTSWREIQWNYYLANFRLARIFQILGDLDKGADYFHRALEVTYLISDSSRTALSLYQLGNIFSRKEDYDTALWYYTQSQTYYSTLQDSVKLISVYQNLGNVYMLKDKLNEAMSYYQMASLLLDKKGGETDRAILLNNMAHLSYKMGDLPNTLNQFLESLLLAEQFENLPLQRRNLEAIAEVYRQMEKFDSAFNYFDRFLDLNDELNRQELAETVEELEVKYQTEKKEAELALQKSIIERNELQRIGLILLILLSSVIAVISYYAYQSKRKAATRLSGQKQEIETKNKEITLLLKELHHRVKNNLQLISSVLSLQSGMLKDKAAILAVKDGKRRVDAMSLIHQKLYFTEEVTHIDMKSYLSQLVQSILFSFGYQGDKKIFLQQDIQEILLKTDTAIPLCVIINELINNSFKHAFKDHPHPELILRLKIVGDQLSFLIKDNGRGFKDPFTMEKPQSFGLKLIQSMALQLRAEVKCTQPGGTTIEIMVPNVGMSIRKPVHREEDYFVNQENLTAL